MPDCLAMSFCSKERRFMARQPATTASAWRGIDRGASKTLQTLGLAPLPARFRSQWRQQCTSGTTDPSAPHSTVTACQPAAGTHVSTSGLGCPHEIGGAACFPHLSTSTLSLLDTSPAQAMRDSSLACHLRLVKKSRSSDTSLRRLRLFCVFSWQFWCQPRL